MFDEVDCKFELKRAKKFIEKQIEEKDNEIIIIKGRKND